LGQATGVPDERGGTTLPRTVRWTLLLGLIGLAAAVPFSAPDGTGMQWDELVLGTVAASSAWSVFRRVRTMTGAAARPWRVVGVACLLFMTGQLLQGSFPGSAFDGFGIDDVAVFAGACSPLVTCGLLARRVIRTRWTALVVDGAMITVALLVLTEVIRTPLGNPVGAPEDLRSLVLVYGAFTAVILGAGGALCTVSTAALRRAATAMLGAVVLQATAASCEAMAIVTPSPLWTAGSDVAVALALQATVLAALRAPDRYADHSARAAAPRVSPAGLALVVVAVLGLPLALVVSLVEHEPLTPAAELGFGAVFALIAVRLVLRIREDGRVTEDLVRTEEDFRQLVESSSDGVAIVDGDLRLLFTSPAARDLLDLGADGPQDLSLIDLVEPQDRPLVRAALEHGDVHDLHVRVSADGVVRELEANSSERQTTGGRRVLYLRDVTTRRRRERELERMAYTDHLTGLPNRAALFEELTARTDPERCLLVIDLDGFKAVNDLAGHEAGDQLLVEVARRLYTVVREDDLVARMGGDEFAVLVTGTLEESTDVAQRVVDALSMPHHATGRSFAVGASVGVAALGRAGGQAAFREADTALRAAKQSGKGCVRVAEQAQGPVAAELDLDAALADGAIQLRYNVAGNARSGLHTLHALPVMIGPAGIVPTAELWAAAERQGRARTLQRWLLDTVCQEVAALPDPVIAAIDLPAAGTHAENLAADVAAALAGSGLPAARLAVVVTEEILAVSPVALETAVRDLHAAGVHICLDDYGMGRTLWAHLARFPLTIVRIDVGALAPRGDTETALRVLSSIATTARAFGIMTVAQGVDGGTLTEAALDAGADVVRSRAHPRSLSVDEVAQLLTAPALA
jgi:diguanylate cyclase (GGDEF)-like protein/PAS domain S-box-containing protein